MEIEVQRVCVDDDVPGDEQFERWAEAAAHGAPAGSSMVIRIVDEGEARNLNHRFRGKEAATNVLSFPAEAPPGYDWNHLGDLVICAPVVAREAAEQGKAPADHWAHLVVHGVLHLLGHDHQHDEEAEAMEALEVRVLAGLGVADPYQS